MLCNFIIRRLDLKEVKKMNKFLDKNFNQLKISQEDESLLKLPLKNAPSYDDEKLIILLLRYSPSLFTNDLTSSGVPSS